MHGRHHQNRKTVIFKMSASENFGLQSIEVIRQPIARLLINYYWTLVVLSLVLFLYHARLNPDLLTLSYYPLYLAVGSQTKSFIQRRIVRTFNELHQTGCLTEQVLQKLVNGFEARLNAQKANLFGIASGLWVLWFYRPSFNGSLSFIEITIIAIDVLLGYTFGVAIWKAIVTGFEIRRLGLSGDLRIRPFYPDGCAGLASIGQILFALSLILITVGLFFCAWIFYGRWINKNASLAEVYQYFEPIFLGGVAGVALLSTLTFFLPMRSIHRLMKKEGADFKGKLLPLADRISDLEESLLDRHSELESKQLEDQRASIQVLRTIYSQQQRIPTWPIDFNTYMIFLGTQFALWVGLLSDVKKLYELINRVFT